jgi:hypothetical protein
MNTAERILTALLLAPMSSPHLAVVLTCHRSLTEQLTRRLWGTGYIYPKGKDRMPVRSRYTRSFALTPKGEEIAQSLINQSVQKLPRLSTIR